LEHLKLKWLYLSTHTFDLIHHLGIEDSSFILDSLNKHANNSWSTDGPIYSFSDDLAKVNKDFTTFPGNRFICLFKNVHETPV
jgi:hypothetical protein